METCYVFFKSNLNGFLCWKGILIKTEDPFSWFVILCGVCIFRNLILGTGKRNILFLFSLILFIILFYSLFFIIIYSILFILFFINIVLGQNS